MSKDLALTRPCRQLDALLLRDFANAGPGLNFLDVLSKDDGERVCGHTQCEQAGDASGRGEPSSLATTMHVEMRNAHDMPVNAQLYTASYVNAEGDVCNLVGIREAGAVGSQDWVGMAMPPPSGDMRNALSTLHGHWLGSLGRNRSQATSMSFIDESSSNASVPGNIEAMPLEVPTEYDSDASVWVDGSQTKELPMIKCSPAFYTYLGGPSLRKNAHLMSWVQDPDFEDWVRTYITASLNQTGVATTTRRVELRPTTLARYSVSVKMTLSLASDVDAALAQTPPGPPPPTTLGSSLDISRESSAGSLADDDDSSLRQLHRQDRVQ